MDFYQAMILVLSANAAPVISHYLLPFKNWDYPLDAGIHFPDGKALLGKTKTIRGLVSSIALTMLLAWLMNLPIISGAYIAGLAMIGDLLTSFVNRRSGFASGKNPHA